MRATVGVAVACLSLISVTCANDVQAAIRESTNIAAQELAPALKMLAKDRNVQLVYRSDIVKGQHTAGAAGDLTFEEALTQLLSGTGLTYRFLENNAITIVPITSDSAAPAKGDEGAGSEVSPASKGTPLASRFRIAQAASPDSSSNSAPAGAGSEVSSGSGVQLQEVVVTAQKRSEKLLDVPAAVSAISGDRLQSLQINSLQDMASYIPGMAVEGGGSPGYRTIVLRGLNSSYNTNTTGPTVATYIDDLPIGASNAGGRSAQFGVDLQPYDIEQVEVLKGPQGTLYGANTLAGLVKYRLRQPDLTDLTALGGGNVEHIQGGGGVGWGVHGSLSLPIVTGALGLRVSGFKKDTAGYIDNIGIALKDANSSSESGGTATLLWKPADQLVVRATILAQDINAANQTEVSIDPDTLRPLYGPLVVNTNFTEPNWNQLRNFTFTVDWDFGLASLTSASGYSTFRNQMTEDLTAYGPLCLPNPAAGIPGCPDYPHADALADYVQTDYVHKFVQEIRLQSPAVQRLQWMLGGYYTRENSFESEYFPAFTPAHVILPARDDIVDSLAWGVYKESAVFANVTYRVNERFDVSGGERYSIYSTPVGHGLTTGTLGTGPSINPALPSTGVSVWMGDARYRPTPDATAYLRVATGYQPGSAYVPFGPGESGIVKPARTTNYEAGFKGQFLDRRLQFDAAVFYIDWRDIQIAQVDSRNFGYPGNGGKAKSAGTELASAYQVTDELRLNATLTYTDAHLVEDAPGASGKAGDQLPESPRWTGSLTADYNRPISERGSLLLGGGYRYRDQVNNQFAGSGKPYPMAPQNTVDLYAGLTVRDLTARLYATNVFDNRSYSGLLFISQSQFVRYVPIQPRTIGVSVDYRFSKP